MAFNREYALGLLDRVDALFESDAEAPGVPLPAFQLAYALAKGDDFQRDLAVLQAALTGIRLPNPRLLVDHYRVTYLGEPETLPEGCRMVDHPDTTLELNTLVKRLGGTHMVRMEEWNGDFFQPL